MARKRTGSHKHGHARFAPALGIGRKFFNGTPIRCSRIVNLDVGFHIGPAQAKSDDHPFGAVAFVNGQKLAFDFKDIPLSRRGTGGPFGRQTETLNLFDKLF